MYKKYIAVYRLIFLFKENFFGCFRRNVMTVNKVEQNIKTLTTAYLTKNKIFTTQ